MSKQKQRANRESRANSSLKKGDVVMVISGGNKTKRPIKGQTGKILDIRGDRVIVEGLNIITRHKRASQPGQPSGKIESEGSIHISNVMYYAEKAKAPVRIVHKKLEDGRKVRGYNDPKKGEFVQIES